MSLKKFVALLVIVTIIFAIWFWSSISDRLVAQILWNTTVVILVILSGILTAIVGLLVVSPLFKNRLKHNPNKPKQLGLFVEVGTGRAVAIDFGGNYYYSIIGIEDQQGMEVASIRPDEAPKPAATGVLYHCFWKWYKQYIWSTVQLHAYVPFFTIPKTYNLPRYDVIEREGKRVYEVIDQGNPRYRSNHVRVAPFTWNFEYAGAEIQTIPFTIKGSAQARIDEDLIETALYLTESWNVLLDQALNSTIRSVVRSEITLDMVIGTINRNIWEENVPDAALGKIITDRIFARLNEYMFGSGGGGDAYQGKTLHELGLIIYKVDITDFEYDGLSKEEMAGLRAAVLGRQEGRAIDQRGQGTAAAQEKLIDVFKNEPDMAKLVAENEAHVRAAQAGNIDALLSSVTKKIRG